ncbi:MAG: hypothetical protein FJ403_10430 [Verrucomicrobia bacterium]|nr:hypothetical protein [Verrucomicrobiota bacterium]
MKRLFVMIIPIAMSMFALAGAGCAKQAKVDTSKLKTSFQSAGAPAKAEADKAASAIDSGNFAAAAAALKIVAKAGNLSEEQKSAISGVVVEMQTIASQNPDKYPLAVYNDISDVILVLEGQPLKPRASETRPTP